MPRLTPVHWKILECIFRKAGFEFERQVGSHRTYAKNGVSRPLVIPAKRNVSVEIIRSCMRTAHLSRDEYFRLLEDCM